MGDPQPTPGRTAGGLVVLGTAVFILTLSGHGTLGLPAAGQPWFTWLGQRDAVTLMFAAVRVLALVVAWYLLAVSCVAVVAAAARSADLSTIVRWVTIPVVRAVLQAVLGLSLAGAGVATPAWGAGPAAVERADVPPLHTPPPAGPGTSNQAPAPPGAPTLRRGAQVPPSPAALDHVQWRVRPGDHFWSIAQRHLAQSLGADPDDVTTARYWRRLVAHNRRNLVDRANPDLLHPGQVVELPPVTRGRR
ncbi:MAG: hypothetical protein GEU74_07615 [Nitriliruptorales bacterium]|nr:hypothetical protein [Nitriliruptorales bacterium]